MQEPKKPRQPPRCFFILIAHEVFEMRVEVEDDEIVVTKPGTPYMLAYAKPRRNPLLFVKRSWVAADAASPAISQFRAQAFQAALEKARDLGWIV
jgi:hypothetical protein